MVFVTECTKLIIAVSIYLSEKSTKSLWKEVVSNQRLFLLYFIPAAFYCLYNNLAFVSLVNFDPTTYYILLQLRMVVTGVIYQIVFNRRLTLLQWFSLVLITIGCLVKNSSQFSSQSVSLSSFFSGGIVLVLVQVFCSCFAGVYTEFLVKDTGAGVHLMVQNVFMYIDSIVCNLLVLLFSPSNEGSSFLESPIQTFSEVLFEPLVFMVMFNNSLCGIITSLFLKSFNSILKIFASALELIITAIVCFIIFGIPIDSYTVIAIIIVSFATYIYSQNSSIPGSSIHSSNIHSSSIPARSNHGTSSNHPSDGIKYSPLSNRVDA